MASENGQGAAPGPAAESAMAPSVGEGRVEAIWIKRVRKGPMDPVHEAYAVTNKGLVGNADQATRRQVTLIEKETWDRVNVELNATIDPSARRANIMVSGMSLAESRNVVLEIGEVRLWIRGETKPCYRMDEAFSGLQSALRPHWGGGAFAEILNDGDIRVGDTVRVIGPITERPDVA